MLKSCGMDSSSDSSSEDNEHLREALDPSMFSSRSSADSQPKQSLRGQKTDDRSYKSNILNVTPEFQNFVAVRLSELLDKTIKECHKDVDLPASKSSGGIRLFKESKRLLKDRQFVDPYDSNAEAGVIMRSKKRKNHADQGNDKSDEDESEMLENAKSVAVSPSWVLKKKGTIGWSKPKGDSFVYKKNKNGELELVDHAS